MTSTSYQPGWLDGAAADALLLVLRDEVIWRQEAVHLFGRRCRVPRLVAWFGDAGLNYRYSGTDHICGGWIPALASLRDRLSDLTGFHPNLVLLNCYRDGRDAMGWHRDDETGLGAMVASVSLGAPRRFRIRPPGTETAVALVLEHGSLLLMDGRASHTLPRTQRPVGERINLSFRRLAVSP
jgi:alkylated DNA repair dioxygenase AlkB